MGESGFEALTKAVEVLRATGPLGIAVIAAWWGWKKDREAKRVTETAAQAAKQSYDQVVSIVASQTAAMVKMEGTIGVLKDVITSMERKAS